MNSTVPLTRIDDRSIRGVLGAYKVRLPVLPLIESESIADKRMQMHNTDVMIREDVSQIQLLLLESWDPDLQHLNDHRSRQMIS